jgi:hypothetical protein
MELEECSAVLIVKGRTIDRETYRLGSIAIFSQNLLSMISKLHSTIINPSWY